MPADRDMNIFDTASAWAERLLAERALDAAAEAELEAWLQADPQHQAALNACLELEGMIDAARGSDWADDLIVATEAELAAQEAPGRPAWIVPAVIGMAAMLALAIALPVWTGMLGGGRAADSDAPVQLAALETYSTARGDRQEIALPDGSVMTLNTGSRVTTAFVAEERRVMLEAGEALFEVSHDPSRPFIVEVGGHEVRAVGTAFNVYSRDDGRTVVTVVEGLVQTRIESGPASAALLRAGDQVELVPGEPAPEPARVDVVAATAWRQGRLVFDGRRLSEVVSEFRRYNDLDIAFADADLGELQINGSFDPSDSEAFLAALSATESLRIERVGDGIRIHASDGNIQP